jgi:cytoskeletal protein RodZ
MDAMPVDLLKQVHPVYGGAIGFGVWFAFQVWRAWKEYRKEQRDQRAAEEQRAARDAQQEAARAGRLTTGFATLDASRDSQIEALNKQIARLSNALDEEGRRHREEMARLDQRLAAKTAALAAVEQDRDRGWDLARECDDALHAQRHAGNDLAQQAYSAGRLNLDPPSGLPPVPPLYSRAGKRPD